jgi:hypothetical protein
VKNAFTSNVESFLDRPFASAQGRNFPAILHAKGAKDAEEYKRKNRGKKAKG